MLKRKARHMRVRKKIRGTAERPRLVVFRSLRHIYAQVIDDDAGVTLASASTLERDVREKIDRGSNVAAARVVGAAVAEKALARGVTRVVFDRGGYKYHGRVKAVAEAAREKGLQF